MSKLIIVFTYQISC